MFLYHRKCPHFQNMSSNSEHLTTNLKIFVLLETSTKIQLLVTVLLTCFLTWPPSSPHLHLPNINHFLSSILLPSPHTSSSSTVSDSQWNKNQTEEEESKRKRALLPSPEAAFLIMRRAERPFTASDRWSRYNTRADCFLLSFVVSLHSPSSPLLSPRFRLVLTLMLTKRFVKQDLSGGRRVEDEKTDKSERKERRGGTAGLRSTPGQFHGVWSVRFAFRHAALTNAWECYREPRWHLVTWGNSNYRNLLFIL